MIILRSLSAENDKKKRLSIYCSNEIYVTHLYTPQHQIFCKARLHLARACIDFSQLPSLSAARLSLGAQRRDRLDPREGESYR